MTKQHRQWLATEQMIGHAWTWFREHEESRWPTFRRMRDNLLPYRMPVM